MNTQHHKMVQYMDWHELPASSAVKFFDLDPTIGLTSQALERHYALYGRNDMHGLAPHVVPHYFVRVRRNGIAEDIALADLAVGDIVLLEPGARVPAYLRLIACGQLVLSEHDSPDSRPHIHKHTHSGPAALNSARPGSYVLNGRGEGVVVRYEVAEQWNARDWRIVTRKLRKSGVIVQKPDITRQLAAIRSILITGHITEEAMRQSIIVASQYGVIIRFVVADEFLIAEDLRNFAVHFHSVPETLKTLRNLGLQYSAVAWITDANLMRYYRGVADVGMVMVQAPDVDKRQADILVVGSIDTAVRSILYNI